MRRELDNAEFIAFREICVEPPAKALVELLGSLDVRNGDDHDLKVHVELADGPVAAGIVDFGGAHAASWIRLRVCVLFRRKTSMGLRVVMPSRVVSAPARRAR